MGNRTELLLEISQSYQRMAEQGELSLLSDDTTISLEEIQFALSVLLDLRVGRVALTGQYLHLGAEKFQEYLNDMIDICVTAKRSGLSQSAASSLVKEKYPYEFFNYKFNNGVFIKIVEYGAFIENNPKRYDKNRSEVEQERIGRVN
jgi:hypothetical protein